jgi:peptide chain release factor 1
MIDKLDAIRQRFNEVAELIIQPDIVSDMKQYSKLMKEYKDLQKIDEAYKHYENILSNIDTSKKILENEKDPEFREMAKLELDELYPQKDLAEEAIKSLLIPKDPNDSKDVILEIRAGAGGDEASIFAGDLYRMYQRFAEKKGWQFSLIDYMDGTAGGYKEIIVGITGEDVFGMMKYESGVHRVQRVPATETQGRIHTSVASVVVMPEVEELEVEINANDVRIDTFCSSGPGCTIDPHSDRFGGIVPR